MSDVEQERAGSLGRLKWSLLVVAFLAPASLLYQGLSLVQISIAHVEVQLVILAALATSACVGGLLWRARSSIRTILLTLIVGIFLEVSIGFQSDFQRLLASNAARPLFSAVLASLLIVIPLALLWALLRMLEPFEAEILAAFFGVVFLSTIMTQPPPKVGGAQSRVEPQPLADTGRDEPVIIHLIFDELLAPEAVDRTSEEGIATYRAMREFADRFGFRLYGRVYSRHFFSARSIRNLMNGQYEGLSASRDLNFSKFTKMDRSAYLDEKIRQGYRVSIYATSHIDFCSHPGISSCEVYDSFDPQWTEGGWQSQVGLKARVGYVLYTVLQGFSKSYVVSHVSGVVVDLVLDGREPGVGGLPKRFDVQGFPRWFDHVSRSIVNQPRGTLVLAHFMVPHAPYLLTEHCGLSGNPGHGYYLGRRFGPDPMEVDRHRRVASSKYLAQAQCVFKKLEEFMESIEDSERFADAQIVIHGDHGSRISVGNILEDYSEIDFIANYATFFAVRSPSVEEGYDCRFVALPRLFAETMGEPSSRWLPESTTIFVHPSKDAKGFREVLMPRFECRGQ